MLLCITLTDNDPSAALIWWCMRRRRKDDAGASRPQRRGSQQRSAGAGHPRHVAAAVRHARRQQHPSGQRCSPGQAQGPRARRQQR